MALWYFEAMPNMKYAVVILTIFSTYVHCRPQRFQPQDNPSELKDNGLSQSVTENLLNAPPPISIKNEEKTREILEKIAEVNKKQGLTKKKNNSQYFHFPFSYYSKSQNGNNNQRYGNQFRFPNHPFSNPIFDYLQLSNKQQNDNTQQLRNQVQLSRQTPGYVTSMTVPNAEINPDDQIPGQYIKRKITHYQSFVVPNPNGYSQYPGNVPYPSNVPYPPNMQYPENVPYPGNVQYPGNMAYPGNLPYPANSQYPGNFQQAEPYPPYMPSYPIPIPAPSSQNVVPSTPPTIEEAKRSTENKTLNNLEKQTIENIKNIVSNSQVAQQINPYYINAYMQPPPMQQYPQTSPSISGNKNKESRQNWNWPGANLFPIYVRDPFLQMYYAFTNMIEYGPNAGSDGPCKLTPIKTRRDELKLENEKMVPREGDAVLDAGTESPTKITVEMKKHENLSEITLYETDASKEKDTNQYLDVDNIDIGGSDELVRFTINLPPAEGRDAGLAKQLKTIKKSSQSKQQATTKPSRVSSTTTTPRLRQAPSSVSPPIRDLILHDDELEYDAVDEKAEDINISSQGSKKVFSKDNTGSGVFIHKLKVRKGGVAIAGPGGIATAGSGGTAIVGPNGYAYTHPDSLAIAGSGAKVIAVDPSVNLSDLISGNRTRDASTPRLGRVVAVGPVVYYNQG